MTCQTLSAGRSRQIVPTQPHRLMVRCSWAHRCRSAPNKFGRPLPHRGCVSSSGWSCMDDVGRPSGGFGMDCNTPPLALSAIKELRRRNTSCWAVASAEKFGIIGSGSFIFRKLLSYRRSRLCSGGCIAENWSLRPLAVVSTPSSFSSDG